MGTAAGRGDLAAGRLVRRERAGILGTAERDGYVLQFSEDTLRAFYLRDVLLHEIGHHVDRSNFFSKKDAAAERYAKWFIQFCSQEMMNKQA